MVSNPYYDNVYDDYNIWERLTAEDLIECMEDMNERKEAALVKTRDAVLSEDNENFKEIFA